MASASTNDDTQTTIPIAPLEEGQPVFQLDAPTPALAHTEVTLELPSETSAGAIGEAQIPGRPQNETDAANTSQHEEENTAEAMLVRTAANIAPDATWSQLFTLCPWPSFKDASLEAAFQAQHTASRITFFFFLNLLIGIITLGEGIATMLVRHDHLNPSRIGLAIFRLMVGILVGMAFFCWRARLYNMHHCVFVLTHCFCIFPAIGIILAIQPCYGAEPPPIEDAVFGIVNLILVPIMMSIVVINPAVITLFSFATSAAVLASPHVHSNSMLTARLAVAFTIVFVLAIANTFMARSHFVHHQVRLHQFQSTQRKMENENMELKAAAMKAEIVRLETQERAHTSQSEAWSAVNHCGKRVMLETVTWMDLIINSLRLKLDADAGYLPTFLHELDKIMAQVRSDSSNGFKRCKLVLTRQQVVDGTYVPQMRPHDINAELQTYQKASNMTIRANEDVPQWLVYDDFLLDIILDNAVSNAYSHGADGGSVELDVSVDDTKLVIQLRNEAGTNHAKGLALQQQYESITPAIAAENDMGSTDSTFLGSGEIKHAAAAMKNGASTELRFEENSVLFRMKMNLLEATPPQSRTLR